MQNFMMNSAGKNHLNYSTASAAANRLINKHHQEMTLYQSLKQQVEPTDDDDQETKMKDLTPDSIQMHPQTIMGRQQDKNGVNLSREQNSSQSLDNNKLNGIDTLSLSPDATSLVINPAPYASQQAPHQEGSKYQSKVVVPPLQIQGLSSVKANSPNAAATVDRGSPSIFNVQIEMLGGSSEEMQSLSQRDLYGGDSSMNDESISSSRVQEGEGSGLATSSLYEEGLQLFTPTVQNNVTLATPSMQLALNHRQNSEFGNAVMDQALLERSSKAKHEERRSNLRRKRAREHIMQVIDQYVKHQVSFTVVQSFVEANFLNDMMNAEHEIMAIVIETELRRVIKGVLSEIYFAHIATLFLENFLIQELRVISIENLSIHELELAKQQLNIEVLSNEFMNKLVQNVSKQAIQTITEDDFSDSIADQVYNMIQIEIISSSIIEAIISDTLWNSVMKQECLDTVLDCLIEENQNLKALISENLDNQIITDTLYAQLVNSEAESTIRSIFHQEQFAQQYTHSVLNAIIHSFCQEVIVETLINEALLPQTSTAILNDQISKQTILFRELSTRKASKDNNLFAASIFEGMMRTQVLSVIKQNMEFEYFSRLLLEDIVNEYVTSEVQISYQEEFIAKKICESFLTLQLYETALETVEIYLVKAQQEKETIDFIAQDICKTIVEKEVKGLTLDPLLEIIIDDFRVFLSESIIKNEANQFLDENLITNFIFNELIDSVTTSEICFQVQLEKDSRMIAASLFQEIIPRQISGQVFENVVPQQFSQDVLEQTIQQQTREIGANLLPILDEAEEFLAVTLQLFMADIYIECEEEQAIEEGIEEEDHTKTPPVPMALPPEVIEPLLKTILVEPIEIDPLNGRPISSSICSQIEVEEHIGDHDATSPIEGEAIFQKQDSDLIPSTQAAPRAIRQDTQPQPLITEQEQLATEIAIANSPSSSGQLHFSLHRVQSANTAFNQALASHHQASQTNSINTIIHHEQHIDNREAIKHESQEVNTRGNLPHKSLVHNKQRSSVVINLAESSFRPLQPTVIVLKQSITKNTEEQAEIATMSAIYLNSFVNKTVKHFIQDIITSIVLPHKIYKRIMARIVRKQTYAAIQAAIDVAYHLEEDTINIADKLLDQFVESQIREMVMIYPNNSQQRRSHTILIDSTNEHKFKKHLQNANLHQNQQTTSNKTKANQQVPQPQPSSPSPTTYVHITSPTTTTNNNATVQHMPVPQQLMFEAYGANVPVDQKRRTRNTSNNMVPTTSAPLSMLRTGQPQSTNTQQNFMFISEEDLLMHTQTDAGRSHEQSGYGLKGGNFMTRTVGNIQNHAQPSFQHNSKQSQHTNQRYNSCLVGPGGLHGQNGTNLYGDNSQQDIFSPDRGGMKSEEDFALAEQFSSGIEENKGKQVPFAQPYAHHPVAYYTQQQQYQKNHPPHPQLAQTGAFGRGVLQQNSPTSGVNTNSTIGVRQKHNEGALQITQNQSINYQSAGVPVHHKKQVQNNQTVSDTYLSNGVLMITSSLEDLQFSKNNDIATAMQKSQNMDHHHHNHNKKKHHHNNSKSKHKRSTQLIKPLSDSAGEDSEEEFERVVNSSPEALIDDENVQIPEQFIRMNFSTNNEQIQKQQRDVKTREPKEGFRYIETKNSAGNTISSNRSQPPVGAMMQPKYIHDFNPNASAEQQIAMLQKLQQQVQNNFQVNYETTPFYGDDSQHNQQLQTNAMRLKDGIIQQTQGLISQQNTKSQSFLGSKSPQHARYFAPPGFGINDHEIEGDLVFAKFQQKDNKTPVIRNNSKGRANKTAHEKKRSNSTNKRALIDLRSAAAQIQTTSKKAQGLPKYSFPPEYQFPDEEQPQLYPSKSEVKPMNSGGIQNHGYQHQQQHSAQETPGRQHEQMANQQEQALNHQLQKLIVALKSRVAECKYLTSHQGGSNGSGPSTSLLMTQLACDVLHSLAEQILSVNQRPLASLVDMNEIGLPVDLRAVDDDSLATNSQARETLFAIDRKIKELVSKLQQNQTLMNKHEYQQCMLQANQLAIFNYQKLTIIMQQSSSSSNTMIQTGPTDDDRQYDVKDSGTKQQNRPIEGKKMGAPRMHQQNNQAQRGMTSTAMMMPLQQKSQPQTQIGSFLKPKSPIPQQPTPLLVKNRSKIL